MANPLDQSSIPYPVPGDSVPIKTEAGEKPTAHHVELDQVDSGGIERDDHFSAPEKEKDKVGLAVIEQREVIPTTGKRQPTGKWEYIAFTIFYFSNNGAPINGNGGALRQALLNAQYPNGIARWGGETLPINSLLLDITGILFAAQLVALLTIGPYADYGRWRPWIMIVFQCILYICQFAMIGVSRPDQWQIAQALYVVGTLSTNVVTAFYAATFPGLVRDLPKLIESENEVKAGTKTPEEHAKLDAYERSKLYNLCNIVGSALVVTFYAIAVGISAGVGYSTQSRLILSYRVLMAYFGAITMITTIPFFLLQKHRPGQKLPAGTKYWFVGPLQVWSAMKSVRKLKQCLLYLIAYFMLQETFGTYFSVTGILQNEVINYSPLLLNALSLVADLGGGSGTLFMLWLQKKYRFSVKSAVFYGACMTLPPSLWGAIGYFTGAIGFHHVCLDVLLTYFSSGTKWEFWLAQCWNFQTAAWGSYAITMISEVVPAPKAYLFFALFNTVGKTSGFIGPFISSAIIKRANGNTNASYWFLFSMGLVGVITLWFVDTDKAKVDNAEYLRREAEELYTVEQREEEKAKTSSPEIIQGNA